MNNSRGHLLIVLALTAIACVATVPLRLYPVAFNFAPVGALCLFLGARTRSAWFLCIPLFLMLATDYLLWQAKPEMTFWHHDTPYVYGSFVLMFVLGRWVIGTSENPLRIAGTAIAGGVPFFLITNFGAWYNVAVLQTVVPIPGMDDYSADVWGLLLCYWRALPFHRGTIAGDVVFSACLFGAYALASRRITEPESSREAVR